jgi:yecA family protein
MSSILRKKLSPRDANSLSAFLSSSDRPTGTLSLNELRGFLFAIACSPELVKPSDWLPLVSNDQPIGYKDSKEAQRILKLIMTLYNEINTAVIERSVTVPPGCAFRAETGANLDEQAPLSQWSRGFSLGHDWLGEVWEERVPDNLSETSKELAACMMTLSFFSSRRIAEAFHRESNVGRRGAQRRSLEEFAEIMRELFPSALLSYASIGRHGSEALAGHDAARD